MQVRILKKNFGGAEFCPEAKVLHLGGVGSENVEKLEFSLPEEWQGCSVTLHIKQLDGTLPTPILLDEEDSAAVTKAFTAAKSGLWMLMAMDGKGYCALTRPAKYDCYDTLSTTGDEEISQSQYEMFVAQVMGYATAAQTHAKNAQASADAAGSSAAAAKTAQQNAAAASSAAGSKAQAAEESAQRAEEAAARAEKLSPEDGKVISVNGKGGVVELDAADLNAVEAGSDQYIQSIQLMGRILTITFGDGSTQTMQTQDTADLTLMTGVLPVENGGTGSSTGLTAADVGALEENSAGYLKGLTVTGRTLTLTFGDGSKNTQQLPEEYTLTADKIGEALGFTPTKITYGTADLTAGSSALADGEVYLVYSDGTQTASETDGEV